MDLDVNIGQDIFDLARQLWPLNRSITGDGVRNTLSILRGILPNLNIKEIPSGTKVFDWTIPQEWRLNEAFIRTPDGKIICNAVENNLHVIGYSSPVNEVIELSRLKKHLHTLPDQPDAIPYITSYYRREWGFCLSHNQLISLKDGEYTVVIDSEHFNGALTYGELLIPGRERKEVLFSTYICHPSLANNELSGICTAAFVAKELSKCDRRYSYRFVFVPEIIGSIAYISQNLNDLKSNVFAGYNITCVGDERQFSYLPSRNGKTISDRVGVHVLKNMVGQRKLYTWRDRGSDEQQYCSPGVDLPIGSIMRTKYGEYPEYHTSLDALGSVVTSEGLQGGFSYVWRIIETLENDSYPRSVTLCEPFLSSRDLYRTLSTRSDGPVLVRDVLTWSDGTKSLTEIADLCGCPVWELYPIVNSLVKHDLLKLDPPRSVFNDCTRVL